MINNLINELTAYGLQKQIIEPEDMLYVTNRLLECFQVMEHTPSEDNIPVRPLHEILADMLQYAKEHHLMEDDTIATRDLFDTKIMGMITPAPSVIRSTFRKHYEKSPQEATAYYYDFSRATNYIRTDRIARDEKWTVESEYGTIDITINLSKPEKDPKDIAKAGKAKPSGYPKCLLCKENEGFCGHVLHPARQNHRIIPVTLQNETYYLQYSPYVYYNEHCIVFHEQHIPMKISKETFEKLLDFVDLFPHYTIGSNADLPIVGGSILSHDHFQGGRYTFAMEKAPIEHTFTIKGMEDVTAGIVKWPMSVIRLQCNDRAKLVCAAEHILNSWRGYSDKEAFIFSETEGVPHNTITPIARMRGDLYELDLVLRNNITTKENPWGVYHPIEKYHHIKKENIGLIEVMGLAVLPARLKKEMQLLEEALLSGQDIATIEEIKKHADWVQKWQENYTLTPETIHEIVRQEIGKVFVKVLECAGVYKCDESGRKAFCRFLDSL